MNREEWLILAGNKLHPYIQDIVKEAIPEYHISVGFPKGHSGRQRAIGQCWSGTLSQDNKPHIFICPTLVDPIVVLATTVHEIIHTLRPKAGHKSGFSELASMCGLVKPWTATTAGPI